MKCAVILYHKNILNIYKKEWIERCIDSIENQSYKNFEIFELNYGGTDDRFCHGRFWSVPYSNHILAMNFLITLAFDMGCPVVFNTNMDDWYELTRFEKQMEKIGDGYQLVSSNFVYSDGRDMNMTACGDIGFNLMKGHNVIAHPVVAMHRSFWDDDLHYHNLLGYEDLDLWRRAITKQKKFFILEDRLLHYRIHGKQVTKSYDNQLIDNSN